MDDASPSGSLPSQIILLFVLILVNAFFAMSEIAIISLNDNKINKMAANAHKGAIKVKKLTANSSNFLSTIQIGVTLAGFLTSASASQSFAGRMAAALAGVATKLNISQAVVSAVCVVIVTIITSYFSLVFGELVPKKIGMQAPEKISFAVVPVLLFFAKIFTPIVFVLSKSTNLIVRIFGFDPNSNEVALTEEEIRMMVDVGEEKGVIEDSQREMINNIFEFDDIDAADIMTHRTDIEAVPINATVQDVINILIENGYSRIPVFEDELDKIVGVIYVKDLLRLVGQKVDKDIMLKDFVREPLFVPETMQCGKLFTKMTEERIQMAIVVDEYGGTAGLVTMEDLIESIFGNIQDEYDDEDEEFNQIDERTFTFDGMTDIEEVEEILGIHLPDGDFDTLAGFVINQLGYLPTDGVEASVAYGGMTFTVLGVEDRRIEKIKVELDTVPAEPVVE